MRCELRGPILFLLALLLAGGAATVAAPEEKNALDNTARLRQIALDYVGAYETTRRFEEYSSKNRDLDLDILMDTAAYERTFTSTALDVRDAMVAEPIVDAKFRDLTFFRVYVATMSPPHPVYVVGVKRNGTIFRLHGFSTADFGEMVRGEDARPQARLHELLRLYYRLSTPFQPGPILTRSELELASDAIQKQDAQGNAKEESALFLPEETPEAHATLVRLCVFHAASTRLEVHRLRVEHKGPVELLEKKTLRNFYVASY